MLYSSICTHVCVCVEYSIILFAGWISSYLFDIPFSFWECLEVMSIQIMYEKQEEQ